MAKGPLVCRNRYHLYVTDNPEEVERRVADGFSRELIVVTNRLACAEVTGCTGSKSFWAFDGLRKADAQVSRQGEVQPNKAQLAMKFMPCFCSKCQRHEEVKLWEQENEQPFHGPHPPQCSFFDDIASPTLPVRPPGLERRAAHYFHGQMGICTVIPHHRVEDADLYAYISEKNDNGNYIRTAIELKMQCRCRSITVKDNKAESVRKMMEYLQNKGLLPNNAEWPPVAAEPEPQEEEQQQQPQQLIVANPMLAAALAAAGIGGQDDDDDGDDTEVV